MEQGGGKIGLEVAQNRTSRFLFPNSPPETSIRLITAGEHVVTFVSEHLPGGGGEGVGGESLLRADV